MTTINIIRPVVIGNFTSLPNQLLGYGPYIKGLKPRDSSVLNYLLSKPPHWKIIAREITLALNISINTVYAALTVLQKLGIASYTRDKYGHTRWLVSIASTLYSPVISPHTKKPHQEICEVLESNQKTETIKTTTRCVSEGAVNTPNEPQITPVVLVSKPIAVIPDIEALTIVATTISVQPELELPEQLTDIEKLTAKKSIAKADLDANTYAVVILAFKAALTTGIVRSPIAYLHGLINKAKDGTLNASTYNEIQPSKITLNRDNAIRNLFAQHGEPILLDLVTTGAIHVQSLGYIQYDEVNKLGLLSEKWVKKYAEIQLQKMTKLATNKPTVTTIKKQAAPTMSAEEFEVKRNAQIEMAMALLHQ
jgi:predicted DNA-binding transcriptional regulator